MLNVGVVGLRRGRGLLNVFHNHASCRISAVCDLDAARVAQVRGALDGVAACADYDRLLDTKPDAVVLATPAPMHAAQAIQALEAGVHVLCEVPAAWSLEEAEAVVSAARRSDRVYMMAENMNFYHYVRAWKQRVQAGDIGEVFYAEAEYIHDCRSLMADASGRPTWRALMPPIYYCTHSLGPLLDILDDRCVSAVGMSTGCHTAPETGVTDMEVGLFRTAKGRVLKVLCGFSLAREPAMHWQVFYGTKGTIENRRAPGDEAKLFREGDAALAPTPAPASDPDAPPEATAGGHGTSEFYMVDGFVQAVLKGTAAPIDVYRSVDFSVPGLCAHRSAEQGGTPVDVPDFR